MKEKLFHLWDCCPLVIKGFFIWWGCYLFFELGGMLLKPLIKRFKKNKPILDKKVDDIPTDLFKSPGAK